MLLPQEFVLYRDPVVVLIVISNCALSLIAKTKLKV